MSIAGSALDLRLKSVLMATDLSPASVKPLHHALAIARYYGSGALRCACRFADPLFDGWTGSPRLLIKAGSPNYGKHRNCEMINYQGIPGCPSPFT